LSWKSLNYFVRILFIYLGVSEGVFLPFKADLAFENKFPAFFPTAETALTVAFFAFLKNPGFEGSGSAIYLEI